jgi:hypothetical protein
MTREALLRLFLAALVVRALFLLVEPRARTIGDEGMWRQMARDVASEEVAFSPMRSRLVSHPPLYPWFLAASVTLLGTFQAVKWVQVVLGALLVPAVALAGARFSGPRVGRLAGILAVVYPELVWHSVHFWSEVLFLPLLWWSFERALAADDRRAVVPAAAAGLLWGLATLTRETVLYFAPFVALWFVWRRASGWPRAAAFLLASVLVVGPWTLRNQMLFGGFIPVATRGSLHLLLGNTDRPWEEVRSEFRLDDPVEGNRWAFREALREATSHPPSWYSRKVVRDLVGFWGVNSLPVIHLEYEAYGGLSPSAARFAAALSIAPYLVLMGFAVLGLAGSRLDRPRLLVYGFSLGYLLMHHLAFGFPRFRMPLVPVLFVLAAEARVRLREGPPLSSRRRLAAATLAVATAGILALSVVETWRHPVFHAAPAGEAAAPARPPDAGVPGQT